MSQGFKNFVNGIGIVPKSASTSSALGDIEVISSSFKINFHNGTSSSPVVTEGHTATLTNKTLTSPVIATIVNTGTLTLPTTTDTLVGRTTTDTLTNKTISGSSNTFSNIPDAALSSNIVTLIGTQTLTNKTLTAPVISTITNTGTITLPTATDTLVGRATTDTLTNKTLTTPTIDVVNGPSAANLGINATTGNSVNITVASTVIAQATSTGVALGSSKTLTFSSNAQVVTLKAHPTASATYTLTLPAAAPSASTALVYDGTNYVWSTAGGWQMGTALTLAGGGTVSVSATAGQQVFEVSGNSGAVTLSTTPFGSTAPVNGAVIRLIGRSSTNTVSITNNDISKGCLVNGNPTLGYGDVIEFQYLSSIDRYLETDRTF